MRTVAAAAIFLGAATGRGRGRGPRCVDWSCWHYYRGSERGRLGAWPGIVLGFECPAVAMRAVLLRDGATDAELDAAAELPPGLLREDRCAPDAANWLAYLDRRGALVASRLDDDLDALRAAGARLAARGEPVTIQALADATGWRRKSLSNALNHGRLAPYRAGLLGEDG